MKRSLIVLCTVLCVCMACSAAWAKMNAVVVGGAVSGAGNGCPTGRTYVAYWDGDLTSGATDMCVNSGASVVTGTQTNGTLNSDHGESSIGFGITAPDERIEWSSLGDSFIDETVAFTIWMRVRVGSDGTDANLVIMELQESPYDSNNHVSARLTDNEYARSYWYSSGTDGNQMSNTTFTRDGSTWQTFGYSFRADSGGTLNPDIAASANGGSSWGTANSDLGTFDGQIVRILLGNYEIYEASSDPIDIDKFEIIAGWESACPW